MKLQDYPLFPASTEQTVRKLTDLFRLVCQQVNGVTEGRISSIHNRVTAAPTTGTWAQGDALRHAAPVEAGTAGSKYVVIGYVCVAGGTPGTWLPMRVLTGN